MKTKAAVVRETGQLTIEQVNLDPPKPYEVLVRMKAAGICHSDLHTFRGELRAQPPLVLGHEGAGIVEEVGADVIDVKPGDRILVNWIPSCNHCPACFRGQNNLCSRLAGTTLQALLPDGTTRLSTEDGLTLKHYLSTATMAEHAVLDQASVIKLPDDVGFDVASIIGCAVLTGTGAVLNTAQVVPGSSVAVIGCGGVGLSAIMGARLAGCNPIIAVDVMENKFDFARDLGATHTINSAEVDAVQALQELTNGGPDYVFDSVGAAVTINQALMGVRPGGAAVVMGMHSMKENVAIPAAALIGMNRKLLGSFAGSARPHLDLPHFIELYRSGGLPVDKLVSKRYKLEDLAQAFADMEAGKVARGVILFD
ncbi:MAG: Zn-dependent alcohol dehydrogenase [Gammaproteobacteria bacterium]